MIRRLAVLVITLATSTLAAQIDRHEIGLRLRACERRLAATPAGPARSHALRELGTAVQAFFGLDMAGVARAIAAAERALADPPLDADGVFAQCLQVRLPARLHDPRAPLTVELSAAYPNGELPDGAVWTIALDGDAAPRLVAPLPALPHTAPLDLRDAAAGDRTLTWTLRVGDRTVLTRQQGLSLVTDRDQRLAALDAEAPAAAGGDSELEASTLLALQRLLRGMTRPRAEETVLPGARLLRDAERLAAAVAAGERHYSAATDGEHWLRVPVEQSHVTLRMWAPPAPADGGKAPLVLALHGAGGSENLFFDGYGDGAIVPPCRDRRWFLVAPRGGLLGAANLPALVAALARRWPIDPARVVVVGHSMGAMGAVTAACATPRRFRAVAALGGGGAVRPSAELTRLPFFVGVGEADFARPQAVALHERLVRASVPATLRRYPEVEHLTIVQFALPDVFAFFDAALREH